jgi:arylsulfatase A-like enzyme
MPSLKRLIRQSSLVDEDTSFNEIRDLANIYRSFAKSVGSRKPKNSFQLKKLIKQMQSSTQAEEVSPKNLIVFIRDQVKPLDLWLPRDWVDDNLPTQTWLQENGLSFTNSFTNTSMCSVSRATFFTGKYPAQHQSDLILSDIKNPILDSQIQLDPELPNLGNILSDQGYDVSFFGKYHLSKTVTTRSGETLYQNPTDYGFQAWQGPDAGQDQAAEHAGLGPDQNDPRFIDQAKSWLNNRLDTKNKKPFVMVVSLVNPHDVLAYPNSMDEFGYDESWLKGSIDKLPPTFTEDKLKNLKPAVQEEWTQAQRGVGQFFNEEQALNYINFYGNLLKTTDHQIGEIVGLLRQKHNKIDMQNTMIMSTSDHGEMAMSHGGMTQKMFSAYDEAIKVPLTWSNPYYFKKKGGQISDSLVSTIDFLPTALNFLGIDKKVIRKSDLRGIDYSSILKKASRSKSRRLDGNDLQDSILYTYDDIYAGQDPRNSFGNDYVHGLLPSNNRLQAIRTKDYKYVRYSSGDKNYNAKNWDGELYDLRPFGGDYYPDIDPVTGELNPFKAAPLEMINLDPKAEAKRLRREALGIGRGPLASNEQKKAYKSLSRQLDLDISNKLQPLPQSKARPPSFFRYNGGSKGDDSNYSFGDPIVRFFPKTTLGTKDLELSFITQAGQSYNINYKYNGESISAIENIIGTNGPTYQYIQGLPADLSLSNIYIEWIGSDDTALTQML